VLAALPNRYSKPAIAVEAVLHMKAGEVPVPETLRRILEKAAALGNE
jgi:hypothetical protein